MLSHLFPVVWERHKKEQRKRLHYIHIIRLSLPHHTQGGLFDFMLPFTLKTPWWICIFDMQHHQNKQQALFSCRTDRKLCCRNEQSDLDLTYFWLCLSLRPRRTLWRWTMQWLPLLSWEIVEIKNKHVMIIHVLSERCFIHKHRHNSPFKA